MFALQSWYRNGPEKNCLLILLKNRNICYPSGWLYLFVQIRIRLFLRLFFFNQIFIFYFNVLSIVYVKMIHFASLVAKYLFSESKLEFKNFDWSLFVKNYRFTIKSNFVIISTKQIAVLFGLSTCKLFI